MTDPEVSVVIPARSAGSWLRDAVASVTNCTAPCEIVLVDDGGNEGFLDRLPDSSATSTTIRIARGPGKGPAAARNVGKEAASAACVIFLDADDVLAEGWYECMASPVVCRKAEMVVGDWMDCDERLAPFRRSLPFPDSAHPLLSLIKRPTVVSAVCTRRPWPEWDESLDAWEVSRWQHDAVQGKRVLTTRECVTHIRQHSSSERVSNRVDHFDAARCGRFWSQERARLGTTASDDELAAIDHLIVDAIYFLLREGRRAEAQEFWRRLDRSLIRGRPGSRAFQPRWIAAWIGMLGLRAHAVVSLASERLR